MEKVGLGGEWEEEDGKYQRAEEYCDEFRPQIDILSPAAVSAPTESEPLSAAKVGEEECVGG